MTSAEQARSLVLLNVPPTLEEDIVDWLLEPERSTGFRTLTVYGHSSNPSGLSMAEQVSGRRRRTQFEISVPDTELDAFLSAARERFQGTDLYFQVIPVLSEGHFGGRPDGGPDV